MSGLCVTGVQDIKVSVGSCVFFLIIFVIKHRERLKKKTSLKRSLKTSQPIVSTHLMMSNYYPVRSDGEFSFCSFNTDTCRTRVEWLINLQTLPVLLLLQLKSWHFE